MELWNYGAWPLAIFMIVIASWLFYRFLAPKRWRDWSAAGLVQAFIIALYAEMYGFPLTLYILARVFGFDVPIATGNLWAYLFGAGQAAMMIAMFAGYAVVFVGISLLARGWRAVYRASREGRLETGGVYASVRHPQYTGILLALFGEGVIHWPTLFSVGLLPLIALAYYWLARKEERQMIAHFGDEYREYRERVPMFLPRPGRWRPLIRAAVGRRSEPRDDSGDARHAGS